MKDRVYGLLIILLIIVVLIGAKSGVIGDFLSYDCRRAATAMNVNWMWDPGKGCFIQQPNGIWTPIDVIVRSNSGD